MNKIFASKFSVLLNTLVPVAEVFVKRRSVSGNLPDAGRAALCIAFFTASTFSHATATNTTYQSYTVGGITYNLVDLSVVGLAQTNLNFLDTTPNMYFSNLSTGGISTTCATGVTCVISTGNRSTNIPFEVTQAPNTAQIGGLFVNGGTAYVGGGAPASAPQAYTIQFSTPLAGQKSFYALTNTWWGNPSTTNEFNVTVNFTDGSSQVFQSLSGVDVRDFNYNPNTSQTISNTTKNWYLNGSQWIDVRSFSLAPQNYAKTVQGVTITQMDRPYSAGIIAGLSLSPYALTPANDITVTYNNLYNMVRNSSGATIGRSATLYNYFDNVMVDVSSKFDGGTLTNSTSGSTLQHFTVTSGATVNNIRAGGYINAAANRLDFRGNFSNDSSVASGTAGKMVIQNISNLDIDYDTHVGTPKSSVGTVVLSGDNSAFNGGFLVQAGANLEISEARNLGAGVLNLVGTATTAATLSTTRDISIANNITVNGDPVFNVAAGTTTTITGNIADGTTATSGSNLPGDVVVSGGGTLNLQGINTYTGPTEVIANSTMQLSGSGSLGGGHYAANIINAGSLQFASGTTQEISGAVSGSGDLAQMGPGVLTLSAANTYTGPTNVTGGTLDVTGSLASTAVTVAGGTLTDTNGGLATATNLTVNSGSANINADQTIASLNGSGGSISLASAKTLAVSSDGRYDGVLSGAGRFKVAGGTQTLSGSNTHSGGTEVAAGATLAIYSGDNLGTGMLDLVGTATTTATLQVLDNTTISNAVRVTADPTFNIAQGTTATVNSVISDGASAGDVVVAGGGTLALTEVNTYSGRTTIDNGSTLTLSGNGQISSSQLVTNNGVFNMAPKTTNVTLAGNYTQSSSGGLSMSLTPVNNPQLLISGAASLAGSLSVAAAPGTYTAGRYNLINASNGVTGKFDRSSITGLSLAYLLGYDANYVYLTLLPVSVQSTAQSVQLNTNGLATMYNNQAAAYQAAMFYDCQVYDQNNLCISVGGRYTYAGPSPSSDAQAGVVIVGYRPSPKFRLGAFADQTVNISTPSGFTQSKTSPMWGFFAKWHMNNDESGLGVQAAAVTSASKMTVTRQKLQDSGPGSGSTQFDGQGFQLTSNYHQAITNDTSMVPYLGLRYTRINAGAYTENLSVNVEYPLSYNAMSQSTFSAVGGLGIRSHLAEKLTGTASVGIQQNLKYSMANYQGTSTIPGYENFSVAMPGNVNSMATASAGIYYDVKKNERFGFSLMWQQQPFINTNTTTALATYTIGF